MDSLGIVGGSLAVLAHLVQLQQLLPNAQLVSTRLVYQALSTQFVLLRKYLEDEINSQNKSDAEAVRHFSSDKVRKLFDLLRLLKPDDSAIVFVQRRFTAKILYYLLKRASKVIPNLSHIKSNFIVGYNIGNPLKDTRENYLQRAQNKKVMNQFNQKELNVLFASNVVEEGIDIKQCNYVIMFDQPMDYRAYVQSKGRARDKESIYVLMKCASDSKFDLKYNSFLKVESVLKDLLYGGKSRFRVSPSDKELDIGLFAETPGLEPYKPFGVDGPTITALSAIGLVNKYFTSLKVDKFTKVTSFWYLQTKNNQSKCFLQLPMESKVRGIVEGTWQQNQENAKRSVALEACKKLHENGELLDVNLLPAGINIPTTKEHTFTPNFDPEESFVKEIDDKTVQIGTKKHKRTCKKKWADCLCECRPQPDKTTFLHVLNVNPTFFPPTDNHRLIVHHQQLSHPCQFALLSSKKLPPLAPFPLYSSTGEFEATVEEGQPIVLDSEQLQLIIDFHSLIFDEALNIVKNFMVRDFTNTENAYLIAPVYLDTSNQFSIDWNVILDTLMSPFPPLDSIPSDEERSNIQVNNENYLGKIVSPWYRSIPKTKYIVTKVCTDLTENSPFPSDNYDTYKRYFEDKYKIEPLVNNQPLLEVRALSSRLNSIKPRALTKQIKRKKDGNEDFDVCLLPEYCVLYPLVGRYWLKAQLLPSVLHRISQLCSADELRSNIARDTGLFMEHLTPGMTWNKLLADESLQVVPQTSDKKQALTPLNLLPMVCKTLNPNPNVWGEEEEPLDIERHMDTATIFDVMNYNNFIGKPLLGLDSPSKMTTVQKRIKIEFVEPPPLQMLNRNPSGKGPEQVEVMQALIASVANDFIDCERLETLGDSFLKFAISLILFESEPEYSEGKLTYLKGKIVGNKNLFFCARAKNLNTILDLNDFSPNEEWVAPGFCVERSVLGVLWSAGLNPNCLYEVELNLQEKRSGIITVTKAKVEDALLEAEDVPAQNLTFINQLAATDKNMADGVEALLGTYLKSCGVFGALAVLNWFKVTDPSLSTPEIFTKNSIPPGKSNGNPNVHLEQPDYLEQILNYKFTDRNYMLQALSHPSYTRNNITVCYQRLEFLGDALIDFVITVHIFEKCSNLSPGDLTDLRSALVNNIILAALVVRNQLHKFLLYHSITLHECMMKFVRHQEERDHVIDDDILFLLEENDVNIAEAVDVPKTLGDIFEALVGAIYLDSGKDINVVWKVVYNFMKEEIEKFCKDVPKNHVRKLYETNVSPRFSTPNKVDGVTMMTVEIFHKGKEMVFNGFGDNKRQAKRAAAKHAMRYIRNPVNF